MNELLYKIAYCDNRGDIQGFPDIALLNANIITGGEGTYYLHEATLEDVKWLLKDSGSSIKSYIGHESTANVFHEVTGYKPEVTREQFVQDWRTIGIVLQMNARLNEGEMRTEEQLREIGYNFWILEKKYQK